MLKGPDPMIDYGSDTYLKGHSDGVAKEREAILAIVQQAVKHSEHERGVGLLKNLLDNLKWRNF